MKTGARLNNIQVLRAFAAIAVAVFHTGFVVPSWYAVGSFGVDVFFVISGYIMARILDPADGASGGTISSVTVFCASSHPTGSSL